MSWIGCCPSGQAGEKGDLGSNRVPLDWGRRHAKGGARRGGSMGRGHPGRNDREGLSASHEGGSDGDGTDHPIIREDFFG